MVDDYALAHGVRRVARIHVRLGVLSALTRALYVSFRAASRGTSSEGATLDIEEIPLTVYCRFCDAVKTPSGPYNFRCPECGHATPEVVTGREMQLVSIVLGDDDGTEPRATARPGEPEPAGDDPLREVQAASAPEPAEGPLRPRRDRSQHADAGGPGGRVCRGAEAAA